MTPERWAHIKALFHASLDMTAEDRETYLSAQCAADGDAEIRAEVDRLLSAHSRRRKLHRTIAGSGRGVAGEIDN